MSTYEQFVGLKARGSAAGATDLGIPPMAVRKDTGADLAGADGDYAPPQMDAVGNLRTNLAASPLIGEVQTNPTSNTVLDRLKTIATTLSTIDGHVDGLEGLATTLNGLVDGLEGLAAAATPAGSNLIGKVGIDQTTPGTTNKVSVASQGFAVSVSLTRTNDTNAYLANDVVGAATGSTAALTFANVGPSGGGLVRILRATLMINASALISGEASYELHLYSVTPPSALGDNAAFDLPSGDRASYLGKLSLGTPADLGSTLFIDVDGIGKDVMLASPNLYAYLVTTAPHTPTAQRVYGLTLHTVAL